MGHQYETSPSPPETSGRIFRPIYYFLHSLLTCLTLLVYSLNHYTYETDGLTHPVFYCSLKEKMFCSKSKFLNYIKTNNLNINTDDFNFKRTTSNPEPSKTTKISESESTLDTRT